MAYTESPTDVMTICDRSHMTHQERQKFWENATYLTQPCLSNQDTPSKLGTKMEEGMLKGAQELTIKKLNRKAGNLSPELLARASNLNLKRVEALAKDLLGFNHVGESLLDTAESSYSTNQEEYFGLSAPRSGFATFVVQSNGNWIFVDNSTSTNVSNTQQVSEPFTVIGTLVGGTTALRMRGCLKSFS